MPVLGVEGSEASWANLVTAVTKHDKKTPPTTAPHELSVQLFTFHHINATITIIHHHAGPSSSWRLTLSRCTRSAPCTPQLSQLLL